MVRKIIKLPGLRRGKKALPPLPHYEGEMDMTQTPAEERRELPEPEVESDILPGESNPQEGVGLEDPLGLEQHRTPEPQPTPPTKTVPKTEEVEESEEEVESLDVEVLAERLSVLRDDIMRLQSDINILSRDYQQLLTIFQNTPQTG